MKPEAVPKNKVMSIGPGYMLGKWVIELVNGIPHMPQISTIGEDAILWIVMSIVAYKVPDIETQKLVIREAHKKREP